MNLFRALATTVASAAMLLLSVHNGVAGTDVLVILDGSGSMWEQVDGINKIVTAKQVIADLLADLPPDTRVGLMAYGHRLKADCTDIEILAEPGADIAALGPKLDGINPKGKTPLTGALQASLPMFKKLGPGNNHVLLVSDGKETCEGDPCAAAKKLAEAGVDLKVHVVGFDVRDDERAQLECIAEAGGGNYYDARSGEQFRAALAEVKKQVADIPPTPKPEEKLFLSDEFEGDTLQPHWEILRPNEDSHIIEDGVFLAIAQPGAPWDDNVVNMLLSTEPLPKGNWEATMTLKVVFQTINTGISLMAFQDKDNYIEAGVDSYYATGQGLWTETDLAKRQKGEDKHLYFNLKNAIGDFKDDSPPFHLKLAKKGRSYTGAWSNDGEKWNDMGSMTMLRLKPRLGVAVYVHKPKDKAETTVEIDSVTVKSLE